MHRWPPKSMLLMLLPGALGEVKGAAADPALLAGLAWPLRSAADGGVLSRLAVRVR